MLRGRIGLSRKSARSCDAELQIYCRTEQVRVAGGPVESAPGRDEYSCQPGASSPLFAKNPCQCACPRRQTADSYSVRSSCCPDSLSPCSLRPEGLGCLRIEPLSRAGFGDIAGAAEIISPISWQLTPTSGPRGRSQQALRRETRGRAGARAGGPVVARAVASPSLADPTTRLTVNP